MSETAANTHPTPLVDRNGRRLRYLRLSVTDLCNLSCHYCNPVKGCYNTHPHRLSWDDLAFLVDVAATRLGVEAIRVTGGEPTVRPGLTEWIARIAPTPGLADIAMTTNGILLARLAEPLARAGLRRVNVSLDTFDADKYEMLTRGGSLARCLEGIEAARAHFARVKVNAVLLRHINDGELLRFVEWSAVTATEVRFIELMPIFGQKDYFHRHFLPVEEMMARLADAGLRLEPEGDGPGAGNRTGYGPATTYRVAGTDARLGFISQMSNTKCLSCNKLRLTSDGALKPCLLSPAEIDLTPAIARRDAGAIADALAGQFLARAERYDALEALTAPFERSMQGIGG
jgi:cyclic pyranopterin phosphate synthase